MGELDAGVATHVGHVRARNEDAYLCAPERRVFVVADGLGGHAAGDVASRIAIEVLDRELAVPRLGGEGLGLVLRRALDAAHDAIAADAAANPGHDDMGTTVVVAHVSWPELWIVHVGDSRAYLLRGGAFAPLTEDHTTGGWALTQALGLSGGIAPDVAHLELSTGDRLLLCTDGLTSMLAEREIAVLLDQQASAQELADGLVGAALARGGYDNVTALVVIIGGVAADARGVDASLA